MTIVKDLLKKEIAPKTLLLQEKKTLPEEVKEIKRKKLDKFGIRNETVEHIEEKKKLFEEFNTKNKKEVAKNELTKALLSAFGSFKIVKYKDMDAIAKQYNLFMTGLSKYRKAIPEENLDELDIFTQLLAEKSKTLENLRFNIDNENFIFDNNYSFSLESLEFSRAFYIMAPKSHLRKEKTDQFIGRELNHVGTIPAFNYEFTVNRSEPKDPIIFLPFKAFDEIFCVVITAWDKVADDLRIRQLI